MPGSDWEKMQEDLRILEDAGLIEPDSKQETDSELLDKITELSNDIDKLRAHRDFIEVPVGEQISELMKSLGKL